MSMLQLRPLAPMLVCQLTLCALGSTAIQVRADENPSVAVTITDKGCDPMALTVPPGKTMFKIKNTSGRAIEWEILQGYLVVEERENIVPGFVQNLTATLEAGEYGMTCGLLSNPKGTLKVTAAIEQKN